MFMWGSQAAQQDHEWGDFGRFQVMVRSLSFAAAIAAMLVIPFTQADARHGGMGGARRVAFIGPRFRHHRFVGLYGVGLYGTCWRWVPTVYGLRRVWVCDPYP